MCFNKMHLPKKNQNGGMKGLAYRPQPVHHLFQSEDSLGFFYVTTMRFHHVGCDTRDMSSLAYPCPSHVSKHGASRLPSPCPPALEAFWSCHASLQKFI